VKRGEVVGIIGRNGAGKSTLLKILSRITTPTEGTIEVHGRIGSLLEVGTGFHPELSGRENIYLSGSILGMKRSEIDAKFDEIVKFAEMEKFLDTPVKRYSSGMYVRLAFAVAAHLEPEILIIDEVLAVGDAAFQKKCLGKMGDVARGGRTVLFVSHNMAAISSLCKNAILLEKGEIRDFGKTSAIIDKYLTYQNYPDELIMDLSSPEIRKNSLDTSIFLWREISVKNSGHSLSSSIKLGEPFTINIRGHFSQSMEPDAQVSLGFGMTSPLGGPVFNSHKNMKGCDEGDINITISFRENFLAPGVYQIDLGANGPKIVDWIPEAYTITIEPVTVDGLPAPINCGGLMIHPCQWFFAGTAGELLH